MTSSGYSLGGKDALGSRATVWALVDESDEYTGWIVRGKRRKYSPNKQDLPNQYMS